MENPNYKVALNLLIQSMTSADADHSKNHELVLTLGPTPEILVRHGFPELEVAMTGKVVDKAFWEHGITKGALERAYNYISAPKALYKSPTIGAVVMTYDDRRGEPLIIPVHPNRQIGRAKFYNVIASIYYKGGNPEARWKRDGLLLWEA